MLFKNSAEGIITCTQVVTVHFHLAMKFEQPLCQSIMLCRLSKVIGYMYILLMLCDLLEKVCRIAVLCEDMVKNPEGQLAQLYAWHA